MSATDDAGVSRAIRPAPAAAYPATRAQRLRRRPNWWVIALAAWFTVLTVIGLLRGEGGLLGWPEALGFAVALWVLAWVVEPSRRQRRHLRRHGWVEYEVASVTRTPRTKVGAVSVQLLDETGRVLTYQCDPPGEVAEGDRPVWVAGEVGANVVVVSLAEGAGTSMAYGSWVGGDAERSRRRGA